LRCDRIRPQCGRCARLGDSCDYPQSRRANVGRSKRVRELEAKLDELESLARPANPSSRMENTQDVHTTNQSKGMVSDIFPFPSVSTEPAPDPNPPDVDASFAEIMSMGMFEQQPSPETNSYFDKWHHTAPMLQRSRYMMSLSLPPHMRPPMCLQYIVIAMGAEIINSHRQLAVPFYQRARAYAEADEMRGDGNSSVTLAHAQSWCLMAYFESQYLFFAQSSMSLCRAIRVAQMLGIHRVDGYSTEAMPLLPPPEDWSEAEERRRTWWVIYCSDRLVSGTTGWPVIINDQDISTRLPASDTAFDSGVEEDASPLTSTAHKEGQNFSSFAGRVLAASLFQRAYQHSTRTPPQGDPIDPRTSMHWKRHREIDSDLVLLLQALPDELRLPRRVHCGNAVFVNIIIHTAVICLHRAALSRMISYGLSEHMVRHSKARLACAAEEILAIFRMMPDINEKLKNPILTFAVYMTSLVFLNDLDSTEEDYLRQDNLDFILRTISLAAKTMNNPVTGSMAVQLAMDMRQRGLDSAAVEKATEIPLSRSLIPIFAKGDTRSSNFVFQLPSTGETQEQT
ncbi:binuclear zinc transcription factor, partial [Colletotrichum incanum]